MESILGFIVGVSIVLLWISAVFNQVPWFVNLVATLVLIVIWLVVIYNVLVQMRFRVKEAWSQIDVQLKRRSDLIPNLVEIVKGYASHEKEVFEKVTQARSALLTASGPKEAAVAENVLTGALKSLFAVAENYPDLKASQNFLDLQNELSDAETKIAASRQFYNSVVLEYNTKIKIFPNVLLASLFNFKPEEFFEIESVEREKVEVKFH
ncbi:MAG: LemA family protein [Nitrososphaerota archaeon]